MEETIYIQIASYRDPELKPTINDILSKAKYPENLYFGICWQYGPEESLDEYLGKEKFRIKPVPWHESKGLGWARSEIQKMYNGEKYTMQLDSHHRFVQDWDVLLMNMLKDLQKEGYEKPLITTYGAVYDPNDPKLYLDSRPFKMVASNFTSYGTILFYPKVIEDWEKLKKPIRARFVSGHFFFTLGKHCLEYKYDPDIYFAGDEISLSIRSFTLGYDLFHPHRLVLYHEYTRKGRKKHWDDHVSSAKEIRDIDLTWFERDELSKKRLRKLLKEEDNGIDLCQYGLGTIRTHHDYEVYTGIDFKNRTLEAYTIDGYDPPNPMIDKIEYKIKIRWDSTIYNKKIDYQFWLFSIEDEKGILLKREDVFLDLNTVTLFSQICEKIICLKTDKSSVPSKWIIWPYSFTKGWMEKHEYLIMPENIVEKNIVNNTI